MAQRTPISTTLCNLRKNPGLFACKRVTFHATILTDCLEHSGLLEDGCGAGIDPFESDSPNLDRLSSKVCELSPSGKIDFDRRLSGTFTGVFLWWHSAPSDRFEVRLEDVTDVRANWR
jgi:hypothetical protein